MELKDIYFVLTALSETFKIRNHSVYVNCKHSTVSVRKKAVHHFQKPGHLGPLKKFNIVQKLMF